MPIEIREVTTLNDLDAAYRLRYQRTYATRAELER
jgi:hypothetical protein